MRKSILQFLSNYTNKSHQLSESFKLKMKKAYIYIYTCNELDLFVRNVHYNCTIVSENILILWKIFAEECHRNI